MLFTAPSTGVKKENPALLWFLKSLQKIPINKKTTEKTQVYAQKL
jgi:hypothetical protein